MQRWHSHLQLVNNNKPRFPHLMRHPVPALWFCPVRLLSPKLRLPKPRLPKPRLPHLLKLRLLRLLRPSQSLPKPRPPHRLHRLPRPLNPYRKPASNNQFS